jgi:hypothetical protein
MPARRQGRIVPVHESRILVQRGPDGWSAVFATSMDLLRLPALAAEPVLLGCFDDCLYFAAEVASPEPVRALFTGLGQVRGSPHGRRAVAAQQAGVLAYARACSLAQPSPLLWRVRCANSSPAQPRHERVTTPAASITSTRLDRHHRAGHRGRAGIARPPAAWPAGRYSTIAGFVELVKPRRRRAREVLEETGVTVLESTYPRRSRAFPSSLMIVTACAAASRSHAR